MVETSRTLVLRVLAHLRHALAQPDITPPVARLLGAEIRRLEAVIEHLDGQAAHLDTMIDAAIAERARLRARLAHAEGALKRIMQVLGPEIPTAPECAGCAHEIGEALAILHEYGITYDTGPREHEDPNA